MMNNIATELADWGENNELAHGIGVESLTHDQMVIRTITRSKPEALCPYCGSIIYSRRHRLCGACSRPLPRELLFDEVEARQVDALLQSEKERHRHWMRAHSMT
jgi:predicted amidophosphoribosyltransferase